MGTHIDAHLIAGFSASFLQGNYETPTDSPSCHMEWWEMFCEEDSQCALAAPRGHAKSTAITCAYVMASLLFGQSSFALIVSDTESQAIAFSNTIKKEFKENPQIINLFGIEKFLKDTETKWIVKLKTGREIIVAAKGAGQSLRGVKEGHKRPDLIAIDDLENEELVATKEARDKLLNWFMGTLIPMGSSTVKIRMVGTILHGASLLEGLFKDPSWKCARYEAHDDNMENILWPERFSKEYWIKKKASFISQGKYDIYLKEYRNRPISDDTSFYRKRDFLEMDGEHWAKHMRYYATGDFAISEKEKADCTVFCVAGVDEDNHMYLVDVRKGRWDSLRIIDEMMSIQERYMPELFTVETEKIDKAIGPFLNQRMIKDRLYINLFRVPSSKSKLTRARGMQARMKAGGVYFDKESDWYPDFEAELLQATESGFSGAHDDQFDSFGLFGTMLDRMKEGMTQEEVADEEFEEQFDVDIYDTRNIVTGY